MYTQTKVAFRGLEKESTMGKKHKLKSSMGTYEYHLNVNSDKTKRDFYRVDERLGPENRGVVYKDGPGFIQQDFRQNVAKLVCSFINSAENGTLMLGVDKTGTVTGYYYTNYEEDGLKRDIDEAIQDIQPAVRPGDFTVTFVPVYSNAGTQPIRDLYVIEVYVHGAKLGVREQLYETSQGVYIRGRDGGIEGPLNAISIQEWTRRRFKSELEKVRQREEELQRREDRLKHDLASSRTGHDDASRHVNRLEEEMAERDRVIRGLQDGQGRHREQVDTLETRNRQLQADNHALKNSSEGIRQEVRDIKNLLLHKRQSRACAIL